MDMWKWILQFVSNTACLSKYLTATYLLTPWSRVLLEKLTSKLCSHSRNSPHLWNPKVPHRTHKCPPPVNLWVILNMCFLRRGVVSTSRTTLRRLSAAAYWNYSQLPSILEAIPPSATWGRAMPWWQGPTSLDLTATTKDFLANAYRVFQEGSSILWEVTALVIVRKKDHRNMCLIFNGYRERTVCVSRHNSSRFLLFYSNSCTYIHFKPLIYVNPLNAELNPICHLLALLGAHHILLVSRIRTNI